MLREAGYLSACCVSASCLLSSVTHVCCFLASPAASAAALSLSWAWAVDASSLLMSSRCLASRSLHDLDMVRQGPILSIS